MPRQKRIHYFEAIYHVMLRGNNRQTIFNDDIEKNHLYSLLQKMIENYGCKIHIFCLMTNHVHLVIEVKNIPLSKIMLAMLSNFSNYYNKKNNRIGHLFQGRYKAKLVQNEKYLLELCYYIHFNPVAARMVAEIDHYPWSSHSSYLEKNVISWVTTEYIQSILRKTVQESDETCYEQFISDKSRYLTGITFCEFNDDGELVIKDSVNSKIRCQLSKSFAGLSIHQISTIVCKHLFVKMNDISEDSHNRKINLVRSIIAYFAHYFANYSIAEISDIFDRHPESISRAMHRELRTHLQKPEMKILMADIENDLNKINRSSNT